MVFNENFVLFCIMVFASGLSDINFVYIDYLGISILTNVIYNFKVCRAIFFKKKVGLIMK